MSDTLKLVLQVGVPLIPIATFIMLILIGRLPDDEYQDNGFVGIKNIPNQFKWIWEGRKPANLGASGQNNLIGQIEQSESVGFGNNGSAQGGKENPANFTKGKGNL